MAKKIKKVRAGRVLKGYLKERDMSYEAFSHKIGCSGASVCMWVNGKSNPNSSMAVKIQRVTRGEIPIDVWGYAIGGKGKVMKV